MAQTAKIVVNQVGYERNEAKQAVMVTQHKDDISTFRLINENGTTVFIDKAIYTGGIDKWKNWQFYTLDFSAANTKGRYTLQALRL